MSPALQEHPCSQAGGTAWQPGATAGTDLQHKGRCRKGGGMEGFSEESAEFGEAIAFILNDFLYAECKSYSAQGRDNTPRASPRREPAPCSVRGWSRAPGGDGQLQRITGSL